MNAEAKQQAAALKALEAKVADSSSAMEALQASLQQAQQQLLEKVRFCKGPV